MPIIASDSEEPCQACIRTAAIGNPNISNLLLLEFQELSGKMIEWRLFEVKQHKFKLWMGDHMGGCSSYTTPMSML